LPEERYATLAEKSWAEQTTGTKPSSNVAAKQTALSFIFLSFITELRQFSPGFAELRALMVARQALASPESASSWSSGLHPILDI
jgi:hypothetical protein